MFVSSHRGISALEVDCVAGTAGTRRTRGDAHCITTGSMLNHFQILAPSVAGFFRQIMTLPACPSR